jgi:hypothetical protein
MLPPRFHPTPRKGVAPVAGISVKVQWHPHTPKSLILSDPHNRKVAQCAVDSPLSPDATGKTRKRERNNVLL